MRGRGRRICGWSGRRSSRQTCSGALALRRTLRKLRKSFMTEQFQHAEHSMTQIFHHCTIISITSLTCQREGNRKYVWATHKNHLCLSPTISLTWTMPSSWRRDCLTGSAIVPSLRAQLKSTFCYFWSGNYQTTSQLYHYWLKPSNMFFVQMSKYRPVMFDIPLQSQKESP